MHAVIKELNNHKLKRAAVKKVSKDNSELSYHKSSDNLGCTFSKYDINYQIPILTGGTWQLSLDVSQVSCGIQHYMMLPSTPCTYHLLAQNNALSFFSSAGCRKCRDILLEHQKCT